MSSSPPTEASAHPLPAGTRPSSRVPGGFVRQVLPRSLTNRIVLTNIVLVAVASLVVTIVSTFALRQFLFQRLDAQVHDAAQRSQLAFDGDRQPGVPSDDGNPGFLPGQGPGTLSGSLGNPAEPPQVITDLLGPHAVQYATLTTPAVQALTRLPADGQPHTVSLAGVGQYRVVVDKTPAGDTIVSGLPTENVDATIHRLVGWEALVALVSVLLTALACMVLVRRQLRPLHLVAATASQVSALQLESGNVELSPRVPEAVTDPATEAGQVGAALNVLLEHVEDALQARHLSESRVRQFLADASHELRTPLSTIMGYAELSRRGDPGDSAGMLRSMGRVEAESRRMAALVDDLLLLARLDSGRPLDRGEVDITRLVVDTVSDAHVVAPDHAYRLQLPEEPLVITGDESRLRQVLTNLVANAARHSGTATEVTVSARLVADRDVVELTVHDDGRGLPADIAESVFERFARADGSRTRASGGAGLGLSIVKAIVTAHGGDVGVVSSPGDTTFTVTLPVHSPTTD
jgi:two-component system OmpR family sensor kinase